MGAAADDGSDHRPQRARAGRQRPIGRKVVPKGEIPDIAGHEDLKLLVIDPPVHMTAPSSPLATSPRPPKP